jgi:uncharacterized protein (TIGR02246 family)
MTDSTAVNAWMDGYRRAWESNTPDDIGTLFADDAEYRTSPGAEAWKGRDQIIEKWIENKDDPGTTAFFWSPVAIEGDTAVIEAETRYDGDTDYFNLWVIRLDDSGKAMEFTEWWMEKP